MLIKLLKYLKGYVKIRVIGYSPERLLNLCNANHIYIWGVENKDQFYEMYIGIKDYKNIRPYVRKTRTKIIILEKHGIPFFFHRFRKRKIFFTGMILCVVFIYSLSLFVWNIHFEGNVTQSNQELLDYLETLEITHGTLKSQIVCETIETKLRSKYPNILWVSAEMRGTRILIQIKENTDEDIVSKITEKNTEPVSIITETAGVIESVIVRAGTPRVSVGEEVVAGQTLVDGFYEIKNDAGEVIRYEGVPADADIMLLCQEIYSDSFSKEYQRKRYTQKKRMGIRVTIFDKSYEWVPKINYQYYDKICQKKEIRVTENFFLPFSAEFVCYLEYVPESDFYTEQEIRKLAEERYLNKYKNILQKGVQIIEKNVKINTNDKLCIVGGYVKFRMPITTKVPAIMPENPVDTSGEGEN